MKRLLLDMDGVLPDFHRGFCEHHKVKYHWKEPGNADLALSLGIPTEIWWNDIGIDFWINLPKTKEADAIVRMCEEIYGLDRICVVTLLPLRWNYPIESFGSLVEGKIQWLKYNYPRLLRHFQFSTSKFFSAGPDVTLLDDDQQNVDQFQQFGGKTVLVPRPWNSEHGVRDEDRVARIKEGLQWSISSA